MKKLFSILLAMLCVLLPVSAAMAESTELLTTVPSYHTLTIVCEGNGGVLVDSQVMTGTFTCQVPRLGTVVLTAVPGSGSVLSTITAADLDGVALSGVSVTLSDIHADNTLTFRFIQHSGEEERTPEEILQSGYLGGALHIVFDRNYLPEDYELLNIRCKDEACTDDVLFIRAFPDADGLYARRSLIVSAAQLTALREKQNTQQLVFDNGSAAVMVDMATCWTAICQS